MKRWKVIFILILSLILISFASADTPRSCIDSDGGDNIYRWGEVKIPGSGSDGDRCAPNLNGIVYLEEWICNSMNLTEIRIHACPTGYVCNYGACMSEDIIGYYNREIFFCSDSDKQQEDYLVRGTCEDRNGVYNDECHGHGNAKLIDEGSCNLSTGLYCFILVRNCADLYGQDYLCNYGVCVSYLNQTYEKNNITFMINSEITDVASYSSPNISVEQAVFNSTFTEQQIINISLDVESGQLVYTLFGVKEGKLLAIIPVSVEIEQKINANSGNVLSVKRSWWAFLVSGI